MNAPLFFDNAGDERGTPKDFFDKLNAEFHFDLDAAASSQNHKCDVWFGEGGIAHDALGEDWGGEGITVFLNPPYSVAGAFVAKAREEADKGARVVLLLPVRSDTKWWHRYVWDEKAGSDGALRPGVRVRFLAGRLNFELAVPDTVRKWLKTERASAWATEKTMTTLAQEKAYTSWIRMMVDATGLPKMAIERILEDRPDDDLLDGAPFPSCVVIFEKVK